MDAKIKHALQQDLVIDITTTGRKTGLPRRIEIWFHRLDDRLYITGLPGRRRDWLANMTANPNFTFHLKQTVQADLPATATPILDESERREILARILDNLNRSRELEDWVADSPLVRVELEM